MGKETTTVKDGPETTEQTPGRRAVTGAERRQALVEAAFALLTERGFEGLRVRDVADRVGINIATLHYHFPGKQDLVQGVVDYLVQQFSMPHAATDGGPDGAPVSALGREWADFADELRDRPELFLVLTELQLRALRDPAVHTLLQTMEENWRTHLEHVCHQDVLAGLLRPDLDVRRAAALLVALMKGVALQTISGFERVDVAGLTAELEGWWRPRTDDNAGPVKTEQER